MTNSGKSFFTKGFCAMVLVVVFLFGVLIGSRDATNSVREGVPLSQIELRISELEESLASFRVDLETWFLHFEQRDSRSAITREYMDYPVSEKGSPEKEAVAESSHVLESDASDHWIRTLPVEVARILVLRGLTPYSNPEILPEIRKACEALVIAQQKHLDRNRLELEGLDSNQRARMRESLTLELRRQKGEILDELESNLDSAQE